MLHIFFILVVFIIQTNFTGEYFFDHHNPKGCNYLCRVEAADTMTLNQPSYAIATEHNGDNQSVADYAGSFHKTLQHDAITGLLTATGKVSYQQLLAAIKSAAQVDFNAIVRAPEAVRGFVSPQGAFTRSLMGVPNAIIPMPSAPNLTSAHAAVDMIEVYGKAICRDIPFHLYGTGQAEDNNGSGGSITADIAAILTALEAYQGPRVNGIVTPQVLFRGPEIGCLVGPYVSQYLYLPLEPFFQPSLQYPQYVPIAQQREFGVSWEDFVAIQNGAVPKAYDQYDFAGKRFIINGRDIGTIVHNDGPGEFYMNAANILLANGAPVSTILPYTSTLMPNEQAFVNLAAPDFYSIIFIAVKEGLKHAWAHKWVNLKIRPEAMAGLIEQVRQTETNPLSLHESLFETYDGINLLNLVKENNLKQTTLAHNALTEEQAGTHLLPLMFPEGSPTHPSYPAGHAVVAGICTTVLKACFDDTALMSSFTTPMMPNPSDPTQLIPITDVDILNQMTIGSELDKLASNIALGRDFAGVHYRSDGDKGILLGEKAGILLLQDIARQYPEDDFIGFELTKRDGTRIRITINNITEL